VAAQEASCQTIDWRVALPADGRLFFAIYELTDALEGEHSLFTLAAGLTVFVIGAVALFGVTVERST
jgi:hypothetical protein